MHLFFFYIQPAYLKMDTKLDVTLAREPIKAVSASGL
jgi:hypothetical protein